jgi:hypothetical protein
MVVSCVHHGSVVTGFADLPSSPYPYETSTDEYVVRTHALAGVLKETIPDQSTEPHWQAHTRTRRVGTPISAVRAANGQRAPNQQHS